MLSTYRIALFLIGCIGTRGSLSYLAYYFEQKKMDIPRNILQLGYLVASIGSLVIYLFGLRPVGQETFGEKIWWNALRPVHSLLWVVFVAMSYYNVKNASLVLVIDTILGLFAWIVKHFVL